MEQSSRRVLFEWHGDMQLPMASTTKIATAITVLDNCDNLQKEYEIPKEAEGIEGSSVYLKAGDRYSAEDLLYGLMLRSGNDCAVALATICSGGVSCFCAKMNQTAQKAGALHTQFRNPHGLPCDGHYTTARDLSLITCYALDNAYFERIVGTQNYTKYAWKNKNKLLTTYDGAIGVKTGYTREAGRCFVGAAMRNGMTLVCTLLNCHKTYERCIRLFDDAFSAYSNQKLVEKEEVFTVQTPQGIKNACVSNDIIYPLLQEEIELIERKITPITSLQEDENGEIIGQIQIYLSKRLLFCENLYKL